LLRILPAHYFYIFQTHGTAVRFVNASPEEQRRMIDVVRDRISDGVEPFAIHTWGIPKELMPGGVGQSSWMKANAVGDALLRRVRNAPQSGLEIGARDGGLSAYWLGHVGGLKLWTAPHDGEAETIREMTRFAGERISVLRHAEIWSSVPDASLDWLFVHGNYEGTNVTQAAEQKLKPGALVAFTGENRASVRVAEQEAGVSFFISALRNQRAHDLVSS
jgi:hypothetical protein